MAKTFEELEKSPIEGIELNNSQERDFLEQQRRKTHLYI